MELLRVAWRTVGSIVTRVNADIDATVDRLDGLRRIGIDEISYKRGHRYLIVVVDHDRGRLVWAGPGRNDTALQRVLRRARPRTSRVVDPCFGRYGRLDRPRRRGASSERGAKRRSVPCCRVGDRSARYRTPPSLEPSQRPSPHPRSRPRPPRTLDRRRPTHLQIALRAVEEPRRSHQPSTRISSTGSRRPTRDCGAPISSKKDCVTRSRSKANEGKIALDQWASWARRSRIPAFVQLQRRIAHAPRSDRRRARHRPLARTHRIHQQQDPTPHPRRVRVPRTRTTHRTRDARTRITPTPTPRPRLTHGSDRRTYAALLLFPWVSCGRGGGVGVIRGLSIASATSGWYPWNPNAMRVRSRILVFVDSTSPWERPVSSAASIAGRCAAMRRWSCTNAGIRERRAQLDHRSSACLPSSPLTANT